MTKNSATWKWAFSGGGGGGSCVISTKNIISNTGSLNAIGGNQGIYDYNCVHKGGDGSMVMVSN